MENVGYCEMEMFVRKLLWASDFGGLFMFSVVSTINFGAWKTAPNTMISVGMSIGLSKMSLCFSTSIEMTMVNWNGQW